MVFKVIALFFAVATVTQVSCKNIQPSLEYNIIQERLPDVIRNHITNPLIGTGIGIEHLILDTLDACTVTFPTGLTYEVYPNSNLPSTVIEGNSVFPSCKVMFRGVDPSMSGTYELAALTTHFDNRRTLRRQRFIVTFSESEPWIQK